ncbi:NUMOD4 motif-containing HNH endonuclease [Mycolicibacterium houstonense]|uniref:NUMOD4 motif-containing HNH endonuclease n=1 Tax=Mycolicibacterium houstonense TaxID=146021 RepID=UPI00093CF4E6|nr:NUMOD4 motif-containing HNH endonuclease [Mycolicibacterium houstonense]
MNEQWRPVPGYDLYEVSDQGRVRSIDRIANSRWDTPKRVRGKVLKPSTAGRYPTVTLYLQGEQHTLLIHRLVLLAFVGPCPDGHEALHFDDDPNNNRLHNLRWGSRSENSRDCIRNGGHPKVNITRCPKGHQYDAENTYITPGRGHRQCRKCIKARSIARHGGRSHSRDRTHCPQGHPYDEANTFHVGGRRQCRTCNRNRAREYQRRKRLSFVGKESTLTGPQTPP